MLISCPHVVLSFSLILRGAATPLFFSCYSNWSTKGIKYLEAALWILLIKVILFFLPFLEAWSQLARLMWRKTCGVSELGTGLHACKSPHPQVCGEGCGWTGDRRHSFSVLYVTSQANGQRESLSFSRGSSQPRDPTGISCIAGRFFTMSYQGRQSLKRWTAREVPCFFSFLSHIEICVWLYMGLLVSLRQLVLPHQLL